MAKSKLPKKKKNKPTQNLIQKMVDAIAKEPGSETAGLDVWDEINTNTNINNNKPAPLPRLLTDPQLVADFNRHLQPKPAPQPCPQLTEGDEVELLIDDPEGYGFFNQPKFKAGDKVKIFSVSKDRIVATCLGGVIELDPAKYGATFKYEAPTLAPKPYSEYADQKTEEYYDKYILD